MDTHVILQYIDTFWPLQLPFSFRNLGIHQPNHQSLVHMLNMSNQWHILNSWFIHIWKHTWILTKILVLRAIEAQKLTQNISRHYPGSNVAEEDLYLS